ncbi:MULTISPECIES: GNAT family N-acetyltransferase [Dickeya]|uniref:D-3-phosphoglycerate dehydrogenase n=2 Tax=Pectobacteriaceae TaxID=1903410 RepID=A0A375AEY9_9GAMM|nr:MULTISPECIES: GNAT family N-acetyltransferase [Dickeya]SLM64159.1 D-3-phosphoglycerate dehydrogenase [Dickeya aquatica]
MHIAILDDYQDAVRHLDCFSLLNAHHVTILNQTFTDEEQLAARLQDADALVLIRERTHITDTLLARLPRVKLISQTGKISQHIDVAACQRRGVTLAEGRGSPVAPAELCWALIMAASRHLPQYHHALQCPHTRCEAERGWQQSGLPTLGRTLEGLTLGIWGFGNIGQRIARYGAAFGMQILIWGSEASRVRAQTMGYEAAASKAAFFARADVLSLHLRLNDATRHSVTQADLALMKPDALFVNISRAELVEPGALWQVLSANPHRQAALDVFSHEPASKESEPLLRLPNVLATPHIGYVERNSYELYFRLAFENVLAFAAEKPEEPATQAQKPRPLPVTFRKAMRTDAHAAFALRNRAIIQGCAEHYPPDSLQRWAGGPLSQSFENTVTDRFYLAEHAQRIVATGMINLDNGMIDAIFVEPDVMGQGIGRAMMQYLEGKARSAGLKELHLEASLNAAAFYHSLGFCGDEPSLHHSPRGFSLACIPMVKSLR